jgi:hypothetical protein
MPVAPWAASQRAMARRLDVPVEVPMRDGIGLW